MNILTVRLRRAKQIFQTEGLLALARQAFAFVAGFFFQHGTYYVHETDILKEQNEANSLARVRSEVLS